LGSFDPNNQADPNHEESFGVFYQAQCEPEDYVDCDNDTIGKFEAESVHKVGPEEPDSAKS
jgi:hypothetical protein